MGQAEKSAASLRSGGSLWRWCETPEPKDAGRICWKSTKEQGNQKRDAEHRAGFAQEQKHRPCGIPRVAQKQVELQKKLPVPALPQDFERHGRQCCEDYSKGHKNEQARKNWMDTLNQLQETQEAHRQQAHWGLLRGNLRRQAQATTIGKAAEKAVLKGGECAWRTDGGKHSTGHCTEGGGENSAEPENAKGGESGGRASGTAGGGHGGKHTDDDCGRDGRRKEPQGDCEGCWKAGGNRCGV